MLSSMIIKVPTANIIKYLQLIVIFTTMMRKVIILLIMLILSQCGRIFSMRIVSPVLTEAKMKNWCNNVLGRSPCILLFFDQLYYFHRVIGVEYLLIKYRYQLKKYTGACGESFSIFFQTFSSKYF